MIIECPNCGYQASRYDGMDKMMVPCEICGEEVLLVTHGGFHGTPTHQIWMNMRTREVLSPDLCDYWGKNGKRAIQTFQWIATEDK